MELLLDGGLSSARWKNNLASLGFYFPTTLCTITKRLRPWRWSRTVLVKAQHAFTTPLRQRTYRWRQRSGGSALH
ncbi:MAG: hypothetical protein ACAF41_27040 [Leptolyngbya sp. BL-A-14]